MAEQTFDDDWFSGYRHHLLQTVKYALEERRPHAVHNLLHGARIGGAVDEDVDDVLRRLPQKHAAAARAHMQFYRACLTATGLLPADMLVKAAVQIEWFWHTTASREFYRDHLAHVMKVAAIGLALLEDEHGPLADGGEPLALPLSRGLAEGSLGSPAIRAAARRAGNSDAVLRDPLFWRSAVIEAVRIAGLLHDMAHSAVIASRLARIAASIHPAAPFEPTEEELSRHTVAAFGYRLLASPFNRGELPDSKGLSPEDAQVCADVFRHSHSLRAGYAIIRLADEADRVWQLSAFDVFVMEWAALAVSMHDYDKLLAARGSWRLEDKRLSRWLSDERNMENVRPSYVRDPVSYIVALADRMQEFGRVLGPTDAAALQGGGSAAEVRYPCRAVRLRVDRRERDEARLTVVLGPDDGTCFGATARDWEQIKAYKDREAQEVFGERGWLDSRGLFASFTLDVVREEQGEPQSAPLKLFYSFADEDEEFRRALEAHLAMLKWQGAIADWHHRKISAGMSVRQAVDEQIEAADIVLLLISSDFLASEYCYGVEMTRALARHEEGKVRVIPVLVRATDWEDSPLGKLMPLPTNRVPVKSGPDPDKAWTDVAKGVRQIVEELRAAKTGHTR